MRVVNYVRDDERKRSTPLNMGVLRTGLSVYLIWKICSLLQVDIILDWPRYIDGTTMLGPTTNLSVLLTGLVTVVFLLATGLGVYTRVAAVHAGLSLAVFAKLLENIAGPSITNTFVIPVFTLLFIGWYSDDMSRIPFNLDRREVSVKTTPLLLMQLAVGLHYALAGYEKISYGEFTEWVTTDSLQRWLHRQQVLTGRELVVGDFLIQYDWLAALGSYSTVPLELSFIVFLVLGFNLTFVCVALLGMHTVIALAMTPFFFDRLIYFSFFLPWDELYSRVTSDQSLSVVAPDESKLIHLLLRLDVNQRLDVTIGEEYHLPNKPEINDPVEFLCSEFYLPSALGRWLV